MPPPSTNKNNIYLLFNFTNEDDDANDDNDDVDVDGTNSMNESISQEKGQPFLLKIYLPIGSISFQETLCVLMYSDKNRSLTSVVNIIKILRYQIMTLEL